MVCLSVNWSTTLVHVEISQLLYGFCTFCTDFHDPLVPDVSTIIGWIPVKFGVDNHGAQKMNPHKTEEQNPLTSQDRSTR